MLVHRRRKPRYGVQMPLTSLIDIVFLLLIYFLLTTNFMTEEGLRVHLPHAVSAVAQEDRELVITVSPEGDVYLGATAVALDELMEVVRQRLEADPETAVVLKADRSLVLDRVVQVMDTIKAAGAARLRLATERPSP
ncbi:ExbD/TolR family protein [Desulfosoma caldarium]|uniref:Outer membrane transport energization protein ExbD n=1 Tax=Desulfosoma caldarium TaxID=610254 RepID=A0A3N1UTZ5_9BACT|nr:biopolymer transporter ExbD [Desulfosoma caldarium]ROQ93188.1 outer membrane transport energization protein ExbD [Desulfosoma caldarium]